MDYTIKLQTDAVTGPPSVRMPPRTHTELRDGATKPKFYLPVGVNSSFEPGRLKRVWATLFNHRI